jgi:hypothetical protein
MSPVVTQLQILIKRMHTIKRTGDEEGKKESQCGRRYYNYKPIVLV